MQLMAPMDFVVCCWLSFFCELSFLVVSVFSSCFNRSRVKSYVLVSAFLWKIKSETAANVSLTLCSNQQISTPISKLTLKPEQPPQEQACRSICIGKVCFFFHRRVKVAHINQVCDPINCGTIDFQVYAEIPKSPHESGFSLQRHLLFKKEVVSAAHTRQYRKCAKEDYRKCHCNPAHPSGPSQVGFASFEIYLSLLQR